MSDSEKPKRPHPDVLAPGEDIPPPKFASPPIGNSAGPERATVSPETKAMLAGMSPADRDEFFRTLMKTNRPEDIARTYGVGEAYLAVVADEEDSE